MKKIRIGNDFVFNWAIERGGLPEDLSSVLDAKLTVSVFGKKQEVPFTVSGNIITIEFTPEVCNVIGPYNLLFTYILPDTGLSDEDRKCAIDVDAFQIVAKTAQADDSSEFSVTSDMAIAFKGDKGDSAYQVWLDAGNTGTEEDYFAYLRQPAIDAGASISELEGEIQVSEGLREEAESERNLAEATRVQSESERLSAEIIRQSNEGNRIENEDTRVQNEAERISKENVRQSNEIDRVEAESERVQAENERVQAEVERQATIQEAVTATNLANEKANLANIAAQSANEAADSALTATQEATTAASLADTARLAIQDDLALKANQTDLAQLESDVKETTEKPTAQSLSELNARITALEAIITNKIKDKIDVTKEFNVWGKTNLILYGDGASTKTPDFIGQTYIDTTNSNVYIAVGTSNAGNWKLV